MGYDLEVDGAQAERLEIPLAISSNGLQHSLHVL
jgi:hypothetical protein